MKAAVVGATGMIGRRVAAELARYAEIEELRVCGPASAGIERLVDLLGSSKASAVPFSEGGPEAAFAGTDVVVSCAGPTSVVELPLATAAIAAGASYVSLCFDAAAATEVARLDGRAREAELTVVPGCGLSPGLSNLLVRRAADELDIVEEIEIALALSWADHDTNGLGTDLVATYARDAELVSGRRKIFEPSGRTPRKVFFPDPVGWVETFLCGHPEVVTLPSAIPEAATIAYRAGLTEKAAMDVLRAATRPDVGDPGRLEVIHRGIRLVAPLLVRVSPQSSNWAAVRVDVHGTQGERPVTISLGATDHLVNVASVMITRAAMEIGLGRVSSPGVRGPEELFDSDAFMSTLYERGTRLARLESQPV